MSKGITETNETLESYKKPVKKDAKDMAVIQQGIHDQLFSRIASATTVQETWDTLRVEFQGNSQVQSGIWIISERWTIWWKNDLVDGFH